MSRTIVALALAACATTPTPPPEPAAEAPAPTPPPVVEPMQSSVPTLPGIRSSKVQTPQLAVHVLEAGDADGVPVVFVHGNVSSATFWEDTLLALPQGLRGVALDLRGYGDTEAEPVDPALGLDDMAADLWAVVDALQLQRVHLVGHSMGGGVVQKAVMQRPAAVRTVTLVSTVSPYGYGGSHGPDGTMTFDDGAPTGVNPDFVALLQAGETGAEDPMAPRNVFRAFYVTPPLMHEREDALVASMLTTRVGDAFYPGTSVPSENWPGAAPGEQGILAAFNRKNFDASGIADIEPKPPVLWVRGDGDQIVADEAMFDLAALGKMGAIPGYPGVEVCPPQPMIAQTRAVLERYAAKGGSYREVVLEGTAHSPFLEKPDDFAAELHAHLQTSE
ncbi:MAG: alpha/beta hydrolase [Myxococcales bacterium]|nr:alpha/beta hydrolase [Myxococcales bacterium]